MIYQTFLSGTLTNTIHCCSGLYMVGLIHNVNFDNVTIVISFHK